MNKRLLLVIVITILISYNITHAGNELSEKINPCADIIGVSKYLIESNHETNPNIIANKVDQEYKKFNELLKIDKQSAKLMLLKYTFIIYNVRFEIGAENLNKIRKRFRNEILRRTHTKCMCPKKSWKNTNRNPFED